MMGMVREIDFQLPHTALPEADWVDCYIVEIQSGFNNARQAAESVIAAFPKWTYPALALRQLLVAPFGLKAADDRSGNDVVGIFPVLSQSSEQIVAGMDDRHLDFRIVVNLAETITGQSVSLATIIKRHNKLGHLYLRAVLPFHRAILKSALSVMAASRPASEDISP